MSTDSTARFVDNWAYLRVEFNWLERMLMVAVARQRKDTKEIDRIAQSRADRVTSHWWQGVITLDGKISYDDYRKPTATNGAVVGQSYQQQLKTRIQASQHEGIALGLPLLCDRLQLSLFEKSLILIALAPEVNRRYAKIYHYLQGDDNEVKSDLPTVNVVLQLLCHNDQEWRAGRAALLSESVLQQHGLITLLPRQHGTLLSQSVQLTASLVNFLLSEKPTFQVLDQVLNASLTPVVCPFFQNTSALTEWTDLVLPSPLLESLQMLCQRVTWSQRVDQTQEFVPASKLGTLALLVGQSGTGKSMAAQAIAHQLNQPLTTVDLAQVPPQDYPQLLQDLATYPPKLLLVKAAQHWLRRTATLPSVYLSHTGLAQAQIQQFFTQRQQAGITLLSVPLEEAVMLYWQRQLDYILRFPLPEWRDRLILWKRAFPSSVPLADDIDWASLARRRALTGGEISAIARTAIGCMEVSGAPVLTTTHLVQAIAQQRRPINVRA